jgi:acetyltransferase-like isoleucine patch superfamily enzyme
MLFKLFWALRGFVYMPFFAKFGFLSYIGKPIYLSGIKRVIIENKVRIYPNLRLETHNNGWIHIQENVSIGQNFHITSSEKKLIIGANTTILGNVFITNIDHDYQELDIHILKQKHIVKTTYIGENCYIGYGAAIQAGTILGRQCVVGANAVVRGSFPDYSVIVGVPAKIVKRYNEKSNEWEKTDNKGEFFNEI